MNASTDLIVRGILFHHKVKAGPDAAAFYPLGRWLIGNNVFAQIKFGYTELSAAVVVKEQRVEIKCLSNEPPVFFDGKRVHEGDGFIIADRVRLRIGHHHAQIEVDCSATTSAAALVRSVAESRVDAAELRQSVAKDLLRALDDRQITDLACQETRDLTQRILDKLLAERHVNSGSDHVALRRSILDEVLGLGPLEPLLNDPAITEIMVNRRDQIFVERAGKIFLSNAAFSSDQTLMNIIERIVSSIGRRIDKSSPLVDARLADGSRVNAVIPPLALRGPCLTIRRFSKKPIGIDQLVAWDSVNAAMARILKALVHAHRNIMISGGTGSGKTTLLNVLSSFIGDDERIITIEDAAELQLQQQHVISLESRPANLEGKGQISIRDLLKNTLRMRPDRIIVGECRGGEALDMLQAMNTGHDGSMSTAHANSPIDMLRRLETMVLMAGMELPLIAIRQQIAAAVHIIVQQVRQIGGARQVTDIAWVAGLVGGEYIVKSLIHRTPAGAVVTDEAHLQEFCRTMPLQFEEHVYGA